MAENCLVGRAEQSDESVVASGTMRWMMTTMIAGLLELGTNRNEDGLPSWMPSPGPTPWPAIRAREVSRETKCPRADTANLIDLFPRVMRSLVLRVMRSFVTL